MDENTRHKSAYTTYNGLLEYTSQLVDKHERNYRISELETLGLVWDVQYFRPYLLGHPCVAYTDYAACLSILNTSEPSSKPARGALTIQEMDLTIKHNSGCRCSFCTPASNCEAGIVATVGADITVPDLVTL